MNDTNKKSDLNQSNSDQFRPLLDEFIRIGFDPAHFTKESDDKFSIRFVNLDNFGKFVEMIFDGVETDNTSLTGRAFNPGSGVKDIWIYNVDVNSNLDDVKKSGSVLYLAIIASVTIPYSDFDEIFLRLSRLDSEARKGSISNRSFAELRSCVSPCSHSKKRLQVGDYEGDIDVEIYDLIKELWEAGVHTIGECEADPESDRIVLKILDSAGQGVLNMILINGDSIDLGTIGERALTPDFNMQKGWLRNREILKLDQIPGSGGRIIHGESIYFPKSDYDEVLRRVKEHNN